MSQNTKIEWCDHTFNPWIGCTKVSPGCANCYAESETFTRAQRAAGRELWGKGSERHRTSEANWRQPLKWQPDWPIRPRPRVFCASMADWLDEEVPIEWLVDLLKLIYLTPHLDWLLLTKRPENWHSRLMKALESITDGTGRDGDFWQWLLNWTSSAIHPCHVWIGTSVEDQKRADERIPQLLKIPAQVRFLSVEPMLGPIDLSYHFGLERGAKWNPCCCDEIDPADVPCMVCEAKASMAVKRIAWCIFGGESGPGARRCDIEWIHDGVRQCQAAGVAAFVKQLGAASFCGNVNLFDWPELGVLIPIQEGGFAECRVRMRHKKGGDPEEWPESIRVREFPEVRS